MDKRIYGGTIAEMERRQDEIARLRRIIKAWEDGRIEREESPGLVAYIMPYLCRDGEVYFGIFDTPAEAYAALEDES